MTALAQINAGARITAAILRGVAPLAVIKGADQSLTSNATMQNDNALFLSVGANTSWLFKCFLDYEGSATGNIKWTFAVPSGAAMRYAADGVGAGGSPLYNTTFLDSSTQGALAKGAGTLCSLVLDGTLVVGSTAGTLQLQWAQNTSNATATIVHAQSYIALWQIS